MFLGKSLHAVTTKVNQAAVKWNQEELALWYTTCTMLHSCFLCAQEQNEHIPDHRKISSKVLVAWGELTSWVISNRGVSRKDRQETYLGLVELLGFDTTRAFSLEMWMDFLLHLQAPGKKSQWIQVYFIINWMSHVGISHTHIFSKDIKMSWYVSHRQLVASVIYYKCDSA